MLKENISRLGLGTFKFGRNINVKYPCGDGYELPSSEQVDMLINEAFNLGINILDTAPSYGDAEEVIGKALDRTGLKGKFHISTKVGEFSSENKFFYSSDVNKMNKSFMESLSKLGVNAVDYLFLHHDKLLNDDVKRFLLSLKDKGLVKKIGVSLTCEKIETKKLSGFDTLFIPYNIHFTKFSSFLDNSRGGSYEIFVKKPLGSGYIRDKNEIMLALRHLSVQEKITTSMISTTSLQNLRDNFHFFSSFL